MILDSFTIVNVNTVLNHISYQLRRICIKDYVSLFEFKGQDNNIASSTSFIYLIKFLN